MSASWLPADLPDREEALPHPGATPLAQPSFPTLGGALPQRLAELTAGQSPLGLFWIKIKNFGLFTKMYGREAAESVTEHLRLILESLAPKVIGRPRFVLVEGVDFDSLAVIFQNGRLNLDRLMELSLKLKVEARHRLNREVVGLTGQTLALDVGYALVPPAGDEGLFASLYQAMDDSRQMAYGCLAGHRLAMLTEFRRLVTEPELYSVYQPVVDLQTGQTCGWEALARGPAGSLFASPTAMFDFAEEVGALFQLEQCCRERAIQGMGQLGPDQKLFLNIHPQTLGDRNFRPGETKRMLEDHGLKPENVVFEITERHSIKDFSLFLKTLDHYRSQGFMVAIDDVGTGFSGLYRIARLRPDFIKADRGLIQGIESNPVQRALMETLVLLAGKIDCSVIAEGIETDTELSTLVSMGVHYAQGYYIARPERNKRDVTLTKSPYLTGRNREVNWKCSIPMHELVEPVRTVETGTKVREVKRLLGDHPISGVVVVEEDRPVGLVMSHNLDRLLGMQYGTALYYDRTVNSVMDQAPLVVESIAPVEQVAKQAMSRNRFKLYDHIVVTTGGRTIGVVSVQKMLDALARVQLEMAKGASPLTGLPGGVALEGLIESRLSSGLGHSLIYVDLDNFKVFNDTYGFKSGDKMIILTADILSWAARRHGGGESQVGHIGGDDFIIIAPDDRAERICRAVVRCFSRLVRACYGRKDLDRGYVLGKSRDGKPGRFPLVSISLGIVGSENLSKDIKLMGQRAAEVKKYAKSRPGNTWVRDRRQPPDESPDEFPAETDSAVAEA